MLIESSLNDLYNSAVTAFPKTTLRQYAVDPIEIIKIDFTPFLGVKTLMVRSTARNENKEYKQFLVFKNVKYLNERRSLKNIEIDYLGQKQLLERISYEDNDVLARCSCLDFGFRFSFYNSIEKPTSLYGRGRAKYEATTNRPPANPKELPGMCKHLMALSRALEENRIIQ